MDEKKKPFVSALWNQIDRPFVRKLPKSSVPPELSELNGRNGEKNQPNLHELSADQNPVIKYNIGSRKHVSGDSSDVAYSRSSSHSKDYVKNENTADIPRSLASQKSFNAAHSKPMRRGRGRGSSYAGNMNAGENVSHRSSRASYSRPSVYQRKRYNLPTENTDDGNRNGSSQVNRSATTQNRDNLHYQRMQGKTLPLNGRNPNNEDGEYEQKIPLDRKLKPMSYTGLKELAATKDPDEILLKIHHKKCPFMLLISQKEIRTDLMALSLIILSKACLANMKQTLSTFLNAIKSNADFLIVSIPKFLVSLRQDSVKDYHLESLSYLPVFLQKFQHTLPSSASDIISILLPLLRSKCETFLNGRSCYSDVVGKLKEIDEENEHFISQHTRSDIKKASYRETLQLAEPPEGFRSLPILPNVDDIYSEAFLRPNVVEGKYADTEHYLDVQYRLLREDYVKPLRDGVGEYLRLKQEGKSVKNCRDVRVYEDVHIVKQEFANGSMLHIAQLSGENFSRIKWEYSKRFLSGSLLCLSSDDFKTMLFASVARRIPEQLKNGLLLIRFENISDEVLNISPLRSFVIIETSAYFEAYRYNLRALHELSEDNLPLKEYIIDVETDVRHPSYLDFVTTYDMRPLLIPMGSANIIRKVTEGGDASFEYEFPADISSARTRVQILNDSSWPCASDLNLDDTQYDALKAAVTREFAIIQGPPGTGKTYIGLRIVQLLLHNIDKWWLSDVNSLPILVVCFTNHALDQFLEGMMCFTDKIVRIGGRGSNEAVSKFQLYNLKKLAIRKKEIPKHIGTSLYLQSQQLRNTKINIDIVNRLVQRCLKNVLGEVELKKYISDVHYISLKSIVNSPDFQEFNLIDDDLIIHDWLGIRSRIGWGDVEMFSEVQDEIPNQMIDSEPAPAEVDDADAESIEEADVEFIEAQRDIDAEDFDEVSFDIEEPEKEDFMPSDNSGWQHQGGKKQRLKFIKKNLNNSKPLAEAEALKIKNVWNLNLAERWNLYKMWLENMIADKQLECMDLQAKLKNQYEQLCEMKTEEDIYILKKAHVVGMTTTGAAKYRHIVQRLNPQILIVEEAAEILESHIVTSLAPNTQHIILIGDHQQLRPSPTVHMLAVKYDLNISLFERMIKNKMDCFRLSMQHRMRPDIADLIAPHIYKDLKNHASVAKYENIKGVVKNVFFITHDFCELQEKDSKSRSNEHEAKFLVKLCSYFIQQGYDASQVTVLTTYTGQLFLMKQMARKIKIIQNVRFAVVDNYQGEENDIILISFVRSNEEGEIGFLNIANRVCVALSRAKKGLFCIGNFELLAEKSDLWKNITDTLDQKKAIGPSLQLLCQNHPEVCNVVANEKDFESVPEGGCTKVCEYRLSCGHVCSLMCHPYDRMHENIRCPKKCNKTCLEGHECPKKCYQDCGPCMHLISKRVYPCMHTIKIPCSRQDSEVQCDAKCEKVLMCGHECPNKCSEICAELCKERVTIKSSICSHTVSVECRYKNRIEELMKNCHTPCNAILDCGHKCSGNCNSCHQGRLHVACNQPCKRILVCGHECKSPCAKSCPPCKLPCENRCIHSKCPRKCGEPCDVCKEKCEWRCKHKECLRLCGEICGRVPCNEPCSQVLKCGHTCIGFCGEPCPEECRICNSVVVQEIFFGTEEDEDARFVRLEDCNHILEISGLKEWMRVENAGNHQIQMKVCPKCKTVIRTNLRFGNIVKDCLKKIEKVKQKIFGNVEDNTVLQSKLLRLVTENAVLLADLKSGSFSLYESWKKILSSKRSRSNQEITTMENVVKISLQLTNVRFNVPLCVDPSPLVREGLSVLTGYIEASKGWLFEFMHDEIFTASEQQLQQLSWEVHRLKLGYKLMNCAKERFIREPNSDFEKCVSILTDYCPFGESSMKAFCECYKDLSRSCGSAVLNITDMEKESILKAMNLSAGHWYQCPNGHVYCITECGGAMQESRCNECNEKIGGSQHHLLATNRVATDMDGARFSAWSEEANLGNYELDFDAF